MFLRRRRVLEYVDEPDFAEAVRELLAMEQRRRKKGALSSHADGHFPNSPSRSYGRRELAKLVYMTECVDDLADGALTQALKRVVDGTLSMIWAKLKETFTRRPNELPPAPAEMDKGPAVTEIARERRNDLRAAYAAISPLLRDLVNRIAAAVDVQPGQEERRERMNALGPAADGLHDAFYQCNALVSARIAAIPRSPTASSRWTGHLLRTMRRS